MTTKQYMNNVFLHNLVPLQLCLNNQKILFILSCTMWKYVIFLKQSHDSNATTKDSYPDSFVSHDTWSGNEMGSFYSCGGMPNMYVLPFRSQQTRCSQVHCHCRQAWHAQNLRLACTRHNWVMSSETTMASTKRHYHCHSRLNRIFPFWNDLIWWPHWVTPTLNVQGLEKARYSLNVLKVPLNPNSINQPRTGGTRWRDMIVAVYAGARGRNINYANGNLSFESHRHRFRTL